MTYIIAWKNETSVFLSSDIAITRQTQVPKRVVNDIFNSSVKVISKESINDECLKVFQINSKVLMSFAGDVNSALDIIENFKNAIPEINPEQMIEFLGKNISSRENFSIIIGVIDSNNNPRLYGYNIENNFKFKEYEHPIQDGSLPEEYQSYSKELCENTVQNQELNNNDILVIINSVHQSFILNNDLREKNVGGIFWGAYVNSEGVCWQKDTSIIMYTYKGNEHMTIPIRPELIFEKTPIVTIISRDGVIRYSSPLAAKEFRKANIYNCGITLETKADFLKNKGIITNWFDKWYEEAHEIFSTLDTDYFCFLSRDNNLNLKVFIFRNEKLSKLGITINKIGNGIYDLICPINFILSLIPSKGDDNNGIKYYV